MKVTIDQDGCIQCGACQDACGQVFLVDAGEPAVVVEQYQAGSPATGEVGDDLADCVNEAASSCPVAVISVE